MKTQATNYAPELKVRKAQTADLDGFWKYTKEIVEQHQRFDPLRFSKFPNHERKLYEFFRDELTNPASVILILEHDAEITGYAYLNLAGESFVEMADARAWLHDLYVDEKMRGAGGGKLLLAAAREAARELGSKVLMLQVAAANKNAQKLFLESDFRITVHEMMAVL